MNGMVNVSYVCIIHPENMSEMHHFKTKDSWVRWHVILHVGVMCMSKTWHTNSNSLLTLQRFHLYFALKWLVCICVIILSISCRASPSHIPHNFSSPNEALLPPIQDRCITYLSHWTMTHHISSTRTAVCQSTPGLALIFIYKSHSKATVVMTARLLS